MLFLINILRCSPQIVLLCQTLNISSSLASQPLAICTNTANFFQNLTTRSIYCSTASQSTLERVPSFINQFQMLASLSTYLNNYLSLSTSMRVRQFFKKLYLGCLLVRLSCMLFYRTLGISLVALLLLNINFSINICQLLLASSCTIPQNCAMLNCNLLYNNLSPPFYSIYLRDVVL